MQEFVLGAVAALASVAGVYLAYLAFRRGQAGVVVTQKRFPMALPPSLGALANEASVIRDTFPVDGFGKDDLSEWESRLTRFVEAYDSRTYWDFAHSNAYFELTVENRGHAAAEDVAVSIPGCLSARVERGGEQGEPVRTSGNVELGRVRPGEEIRIEAWSRIGPVSLDRAVVRLFLRNGRGRVEAFKVVPPSEARILEIYKTAGPLLVFLIGILMLATVLSVL